MTQDTQMQQPILEQILDATFEALATSDYFDATALAALRTLAKSGGLKKAPLVTKAVQIEAGRAK